MRIWVRWSVVEKFCLVGINTCFQSSTSAFWISFLNLIFWFCLQIVITRQQNFFQILQLNTKNLSLVAIIKTSSHSWLTWISSHCNFEPSLKHVYIRNYPWFFSDFSWSFNFYIPTSLLQTNFIHEFLDNSRQWQDHVIHQPSHIPNGTGTCLVGSIYYSIVLSTSHNISQIVSHYCLNDFYRILQNQFVRLLAHIYSSWNLIIDCT